jgi:glycosyltransferase involved in cell wall biosynthesis
VKQLRICFASGLSIAGAERQTASLAKILSQQHDVVLVGLARKEDKVDLTGWEGLQLEVVRFEMGYHNYLVLAHLALLRKLRQLQPDVCIQRAVGDATGFVGTSCRIIHSRFIYHSASNLDANPRLTLWLSPSPISLLYYSVGLLLADVIVAQTHEIASQFRRKFLGTKHVAIVPQVYDASAVKVPREKGDFVFWLARLVWYKRPDLFLKLAEALPEVHFVMAGGGPLETEIARRSSLLRNVTFLGPVTHEYAERLCGRAKAFVNTSVIEGFPNTLLEAGARETPYVSLQYDPDGLICNRKIGFHSRSFASLIDDVRQVVHDDQLRARLGRNARKYVLEEHSPQLALKAYSKILDSLPTRR